MKKFEEPILKLEVIDMEDVITTSTCEEYGTGCPSHECPVDAGEF